MVPDTPSAGTVDTPTNGTGSNSLINALIGGVAGIILSFIPLSPVLGGGIAGYLEDGDPRDGLKVGAIGGVIMLIPIVLIGTFFLAWMLGVAGSPAGFGLIAVIMLVFGAIYTVGLSAAGGYLGVYVKDEL